MSNLQWTYSVTYVDIETGEILTAEKAIKNYIIIKTEKDVKITERYGHTKWTKYCRTKPIQGKLF